MAQQPRRVGLVGRDVGTRQTEAAPQLLAAGDALAGGSGAVPGGEAGAPADPAEPLARRPGCGADCSRAGARRCRATVVMECMSGKKGKLRTIATAFCRAGRGGRAQGESNSGCRG